MFDPLCKPDALPLPSLDNESLLRLRASLVAYANRLLAGPSRTAAFGLMPAEDAASEAVVVALEILDGRESTRTWDPAKVSMLTFCRGVVRSKISDNARSAMVRDSADCQGDLETLGRSVAPDQELRLIRDELRGELFKPFKDDVVANDIVQAILEDRWTTQGAYAAASGLSMNQVKAAWKKIHRRAKKLVGASDD